MKRLDTCVIRDLQSSFGTIKALLHARFEDSLIDIPFLILWRKTSRGLFDGF